MSGGHSNNRELGMGHVYRCINLASNFDRRNLFFAIEDFGGVSTVLKNKNFKNILQIKKKSNINEDINQTIDFIKMNKIDVVVVDIYNVNLNLLKNISCFAKLVVISDLNKIDFPADLVVNGFIGYKNSIYQNKYGAKCLLGPKYQILDKRFGKISKAKQNKKILLITFGGLDKKNISEQICKIIQNNNYSFKVRIILGSATKKTKYIKKLELNQKSSITIISKTENMIREISNATYGICAGGLTTYEFATRNLPMAIICQYKHQIKTASEWEKSNMAINLGLYQKKNTQKIEKILKRFDEANIKFSKKKIVDGKGSKRIANEIMKLC
jgi:UDP-2,4-diacetamido-2,4,6-trideoxy-beta-L-altropyranose hydrolase